jgi:TonB-dependent SusC/RagA subfamily outer membrane receptor
VVLGRGADASGLDPAQIERVEVIKGAEAVRRYGERAASGVVLITTKRAGGEKPAALVETPRRVESALTVTPLTRPAPLYVVDGVVVPSTEASSIEGVVPRERIRSISVLKGAQAVSLYGARAAGGVISIATVPATPVIREVPARAATAPAERVIAVPPAIIEALRTEGGIPFEAKGGRVLLRVGVGVRLEAGSPPADANDAIVVVDGVIVGLTSQRGGGALTGLDGLRMEDVESVEVVKRGTAEAGRWGWSFVFVTTRAGR